MTQNETTSGGAVWRKRAIASVGALAAVAAGSVALASSASAAAPLPSISLSAPAQVFDGGGNFAAQPLSISFKNNALGATDQANATLSLTFTGVPTTVPCATAFTFVDDSADNVPASTSPTFGPATSPTPGTCQFSVAQPIPAGLATQTYNYFLDVNTRTVSAPNGLTATLTDTATLSFPDPGSAPPTSTVVSSTPVTTQVVGTTAASVAGTPTAAPIYKGYNFQLFNNAFPSAAVAGNGTITVTDVKTGAAVTPGACPANTSAKSNDVCYELNGGADDLYFDATSGRLIRAATNTFNIDPFPDTYKITETNNAGTATATIVVPILFSDVSTTAPFASEIYKLALAGTLTGYTDGTFRPAAAVTRQAFAHYLYESYDLLNDSNQNYELVGGGPSNLDDGACTTANGGLSAFTDVSDSSPFCVSIRELHDAGIISGYTTTTFGPTTVVSRQAIAAFVFRAYNYGVTGDKTSPDANCSSPTGFTDVSASNKFCGDIEFLASTGLANGYSDGGFHPAVSSSRQATAAFLSRIPTSGGLQP